MLKYAAIEDQPAQGRTRNQLREDEQPVFDKFTSAQFVQSLVTFLTLEENKAKDKFHAKHFMLFKVIPVVVIVVVEVVVVFVVGGVGVVIVVVVVVVGGSCSS